MLAKLRPAELRGFTATVVAVPLILAHLSGMIFRDPTGPSTNLRSIVILPCGGSIVGQLSGTFLGLTPLGALRANMPPALSLALLAMFLRVQGVTYVLGVLEGTLVIFVIFRLWRLCASGTSR